MEWMKIIGDSVQFIEEHLTDDLSVDEIAKAVNVSPFYFPKRLCYALWLFSL